MTALADIALALDVGGTFTDVLMVDRATGRTWTTKTPSVPSDPSEGFFNGVDKVLAQAGIGADRVALVLHGSTVATNAVLEGKGARTGMLVTDGFKFVLEIGRAEIPRRENLYSWIKPKRPVPPRLIREVPERMLIDGTIDRPIDEAACREAARALKALGVEAVAVVFLHAYANPAHERRAGEILAEEIPAAQVSLSSDVLPVFREYERSIATVLNATVQPLAGRYVERLSGGLAGRRIAAPLLVMKSNGGVFGPAQAAKQAIHMALSGPAAGAIGAAHLCRLAGFPNAITIDIGGTSADVTLIEGGQPRTTIEGEIGPFPLAVPIVDIHTIGAGGGSIARVTPQGGLVVGPESAGAHPGPACYGTGGEQPTVTDANLVLGRVPDRLLGGEMALSRDLAEAAIRRHVAEPLGLDPLEAAHGILRIVNGNMVGALKVVSVEKGRDPRDFALVAFGGAGPMQAGDLARLLGTPTVLIPRHPGILCAFGLLATDLVADHVRTRLQRAPDYDVAAIAETFEALAREADAELAAEGVPAERREAARFADLRYAKQGYEITVPMPGGPVDTAALDRLVETFHAAHEQLYTFADRSAPVEIVNMRLRATGRMAKVEPPEIGRVADGTPAEPVGAREVCFDGRALVPTPVHAREGLMAGHVIEGPAIVDQLDTTSVIFPGQTARVDAIGNLVVTFRGPAGGSAG